MKKVVYIHEDDIKIIIAKHFEVRPEDVDLEYFNKTVGYGKNEYYEPSVRVVISLPYTYEHNDVYERSNL